MRMIDWTLLNVQWQMIHAYSGQKHTALVMVSVLASSAESHELNLHRGYTKDIKVSICCFYAKHATFRSKHQDWDWVLLWGSKLKIQCQSSTKQGVHSSLLTYITCISSWVCIKYLSLDIQQDLINQST